MNTNKKTTTLVGLGILTAVVIILQALANGIHLGPFSITLVLAPIIIGAALYGILAGTWLGLVFGIVVLLTDAGVFLAVSVPGTILVCLAKGVLAGVAAGAVYRLVAKKNRLVAVILAALVAPVVNTGVFLIGCRLFFYDTVASWADGYESVVAFMFFGLVGANFIVETIVNLVLSSVIVQIMQITSSHRKAVRSRNS